MNTPRVYMMMGYGLRQLGKVRKARKELKDHDEMHKKQIFVERQKQAKYARMQPDDARTLMEMENGYTLDPSIQ